MVWAREENTLQAVPVGPVRVREGARMEVASAAAAAVVAAKEAVEVVRVAKAAAALGVGSLVECRERELVLTVPVLESVAVVEAVVTRGAPALTAAAGASGEMAEGVREAVAMGAAAQEAAALEA